MPHYVPSRVCYHLSIGATQLSSIADNTNSILIATSNVDRQLHLYRLKIEFSQPSSKQSLYHSASLHSQHVSMVGCPLPSVTQEDRDRNRGDNGELGSDFQLSFLDILATGDWHDDVKPTGPLIFTIHSSVPSMNRQGRLRSQPYSIVSQWELQHTQIGLHASFGHLSSKRPSSNTTTALPVGLARLT